MLLLLRDHGYRPWTPREVSAALRTTPESVERRLAALAAAALVSRGDDGFRFDAGERTGSVSELARCYASRRVAVIEAIFAGEGEPEARPRVEVDTRLH